jgi:chromosome segregation ATPase
MTNNLEKNLELRKALAEVDRLTALNLELETVNKDLWVQQAKLDQKVSEQKERLRKNEVMLKSYEKDITDLQKTNQLLELSYDEHIDMIQEYSNKIQFYHEETKKMNDRIKELSKDYVDLWAKATDRL